MPVNLARRHRRNCLSASLLLAALVLTVLLPLPGRTHDPQDLILEQVGVDERLGALLPRDLSFLDQTGRPVLLADYLTGLPVVLTLNYYACPTLCPLVLRNLVATIGGVRDLRLGKDFRIVTVSINPQESAALALEKSNATYAMLRGVADPANSWPFLRGGRSSIEPLAQAVGVRYTVLENGEFAHPNVIIVVTPQGRISRYLYGLEQRPKDLRLALIEATGGRIGGSALVNQALLYCFHYDPVGKKYVLFASRIMTGAMLGVLALTLGMLALLWKREKKAPPG